jgi:hypothetical protein
MQHSRSHTTTTEQNHVSEDGNNTKADRIDRQCSDHLIQLIINQDQCFQSWMKFMITIEVALAGAYGVVFKAGPPNALPAWAGGAKLLALILPPLGLSVILGLTAIMVREHKWQHLYVKKYSELPNYKGKVFPIKQSEVSSVPIGDNSRQIIGLAILVGLFWVFAFFLAIFAA